MSSCWTGNGCDMPKSNVTETASPRCGAVGRVVGGVTGALFEIGVLAALEEILGFPVATAFDAHIGASADAIHGSSSQPAKPLDGRASVI